MTKTPIQFFLSATSACILSVEMDDQTLTLRPMVSARIGPNVEDIELLVDASQVPMSFTSQEGMKAIIDLLQWQPSTIAV